MEKTFEETLIEKVQTLIGVIQRLQEEVANKKKAIQTLSEQNDKLSSELWRAKQEQDVRIVEVFPKTIYINGVTYVQPEDDENGDD